mmetsp:Transcript_29213/g.80256  ORF Transcript_29213/g.80256 Transcript_29213/m.80256 type:complete len:117 (-) Transcript_29213:622-972(-)
MSVIHVCSLDGPNFGGDLPFRPGFGDHLQQPPRWETPKTAYELNGVPKRQKIRIRRQSKGTSQSSIQFSHVLRRNKNWAVASPSTKSSNSRSLYKNNGQRLIGESMVTCRSTARAR